MMNCPTAHTQRLLGELWGHKRVILCWTTTLARLTLIILIKDKQRNAPFIIC